jgi:hypothetical protein
VTTEHNETIEEIVSNCEEDSYLKNNDFNNEEIENYNNNNILNESKKKVNERSLNNILINISKDYEIEDW